MRILGVSNPTFVGVTVATKAIVTDYYPLSGIDVPGKAIGLAQAISRWKPDILVIGGWSTGYEHLVEELSKGRNFPILCVYHSTLFHGKFFGDDRYLKTIDSLLERRIIDWLGYVHPEQSRYEYKIRGKIRPWVPHAFKPKHQMENLSQFSIGVLGGTASSLKNTEGSMKVVEEYVKNNPGTQIISNQNYDKKHEQFLNVISRCSVVVHTSLLEAYSNLIQECWSMGIPAIFSPQCRGLSESPLLTRKESFLLNKLCVTATNNPYELYEMIDFVRLSWNARSNEVYGIYKDLYNRTNEYTAKLFTTMLELYHKRRGGSSSELLMGLFADSDSDYVV